MTKLFLIRILAIIWVTSPLFCVRGDILDHWTTYPIATNSFALQHVVYGNGVYVATAEYGDGGAIYSSADGFHWIQRFSDYNSWGLTLNFSEGHFAGVGGFGVADVSADGTNWTSTFLPQFDHGIGEGQAITYGTGTVGNGLYATVGDQNGVGTLQISKDGTNWTSCSVTGGVGGRISGIAYGPNRFVAIGNNDGMIYNYTGFPRGTNWLSSSILGGNKIGYANGLFIVPFNNGTNLISTDGGNWSVQPTGLTNMLGVVSYSGGLFMAQCAISAAGSYLATSTNGTNWFQYPQRLPDALDPMDLPDPDVNVATDGTRLVTIGQTVSTNVTPNQFINNFYTSDVLVGIRTTNNTPGQVIISGLVGRNYQIQFANSLGTDSNNWQTNLSLQLPATPYVWTDTTVTNATRFYRGVLMP